MVIQGVGNTLSHIQKVGYHAKNSNDCVIIYIYILLLSAILTTTLLIQPFGSGLV